MAHHDLYQREVTPVNTAGTAIDFSLLTATDLAVLGTTADVRAVADEAGTISAKLRGLTYLIGTLITNFSSYSGLWAAEIGLVSDAKVTGDVNGTLHARVRGLAAALSDSVADAKVQGDAAGSLHAKLRGISTTLADSSTDAKVQGDTAGSLHAKLRGISTTLADSVSDAKVQGDNAGSLHAKVRGMNTTLTAILTGPISVTGSNVGGYSKIVTATLTRPNDTTAYAAGDQVADSTSAPTILTFSNCGRTSGGSGVIVGATLIDHSNQATAPDLELWIFNTTATPNNDNAAFAPSDNTADTCIGVIHFTASYAGDSATSGNKFYDAGPFSIPYVCTTTDLYGMLVVRNAYTPTAQEVWKVALRLLQD
jgi:hypothetical protein